MGFVARGHEAEPRPICRLKQGNEFPLNQNRNNNRRRGRNNRGQGGGSQGNRIDSRARGNAPQLLEKYKKLAHDAALNGDRVQAECYLQYADHYFRVIADSRVVKDDQPRARQYERDQDDDGGSDGDDDDDDHVDSSGERNGQHSRHSRNDHQAQSSRHEPASRNEDVDDVSDDEPSPPVRAAKPRRERGPRPGQDREPLGLDPASLPPAIGKDSDPAEDEAVRPPRRTRSRRPAGGDEALEAAS